jgi:hypothetical protein
MSLAKPHKAKQLVTRIKGRIYLMLFAADSFFILSAIGKSPRSYDKYFKYRPNETSVCDYIRVVYIHLEANIAEKTIHSVKITASGIFLFVLIKSMIFDIIAILSSKS